jgi:hypothetical protein
MRPSLADFRFRFSLVPRFDHLAYLREQSESKDLPQGCRHLGLKPGNDLTQAVFDYFTTGPSSLLVLNNLESVGANRVSW